MDIKRSAEETFARALSALEHCLYEERWEAAGEAAEALATACAACTEAGVRLPPEALEEAEAAYARCLERAIGWGQELQSEAQTAGASNRALQSYTRG